MVRDLSSLEGIKSGFILNLDGGPTGQMGNTVHPFNCPHVGHMTIPPRKLWGSTVDELEAWVLEAVGDLDPTYPTCRYV
jgi:hypothetical protein